MVVIVSGWVEDVVMLIGLMLLPVDEQAGEKQRADCAVEEAGESRVGGVCHP